MHKKNIALGELSPESITYCQLEEEIKIVDFSKAVKIDSRNHFISEDYSFYSAPEIIKGDQIT